MINIIIINLIFLLNNLLIIHGIKIRRVRRRIKKFMAIELTLNPNIIWYLRMWTYLLRRKIKKVIRIYCIWYNFFQLMNTSHLILHFIILVSKNKS